MLDALGRGDQGGILHVGVAGGIDNLLGFVDECAHGLARHADDGVTEVFHHLFNARELLLRLLQVKLKAFLQFFGVRRVDHFGQRIYNRRLCIAQLVEAVHEEVFK